MINALQNNDTLVSTDDTIVYFYIEDNYDELFMQGNFYVKLNFVDFAKTSFKNDTNNSLFIILKNEDVKKLALKFIKNNNILNSDEYLEFNFMIFFNQKTKRFDSIIFDYYDAQEIRKNFLLEIKYILKNILESNAYTNKNHIEQILRLIDTDINFFGAKTLYSSYIDEILSDILEKKHNIQQNIAKSIQYFILLKNAAQ